MDHQAFAQLLGNYGEFVGAVAVVVTLLYLSLQIRQNTRVSQAASREAVSRIAIELMMGLTADQSRVAFWRRALTNPGSLDGDEKLRGAMTAYALMESWEMAHSQWSRGVLSDKDWEKWDSVIANYMATPGFQMFWDEAKGDLGAEFVAHVSESRRAPNYRFV